MQYLFLAFLPDIYYIADAKLTNGQIQQSLFFPNFQTYVLGEL